MHSLSAGVTQSWFVAKAAVALVPIVIFGAADVIGWFLRRTLWRRKTRRLGRGVQGANGPGVLLHRDEARGSVADRLDAI